MNILVNSWYDTAPRCPTGATRTEAATEGWGRWCQEHLGHMTVIFGDLIWVIRTFYILFNSFHFSRHQYSLRDFTYALSYALSLYLPKILETLLYWSIHPFIFQDVLGCKLETCVSNIGNLQHDSGYLSHSVLPFAVSTVSGVNPAAAKSLLGAATSVGDSFSSDASTSSIAQGARSAQLRVLVPWHILGARSGTSHSVAVCGT